MYTLINCIGTECKDISRYTTREAAQLDADGLNKSSNLYHNNLYTYAVVKEKKIEIIE